MFMNLGGPGSCSALGRGHQAVATLSIHRALTQIPEMFNVWSMLLMVPVLSWAD